VAGDLFAGHDDGELTGSAAAAASGLFTSNFLKINNIVFLFYLINIVYL
jgi:hypothetical protein